MTQPQPGQDAGRGIHRFTVGALTCAVVSDGQLDPPWDPPLREFFTPATGVPERELRAAAAREGRARPTVTCGYNCLCVETADGFAVIDTGLGRGFPGYGPHITPLVGRFAGRLAEAGLRGREPAAVLFTHLHEDHTRGAVWPGEPAFPDAAAYAHAAELAYWSAPSCPAPADQRGPALRAIRALGAGLRAFEYGAEVLPNVRTVEAAGHTPGHTAFLLESRGERLLCAGDTFHDPLQLGHLAWRTPWDLDGPRSVLSRRRLLDLAAAERLPVHAYHLPFPGLGLVERHGDAFTWQPVLP
ncbi:MBL fold metallo-hydrolase [Nonomuraea pusilla]|uniref:Glyoxylase, beta-lactamase superfamily II n=1 Tax=Nonomuraea pusilla TaxID=46177 RepID=A0A1H7ZMM1_9ACTN|nr:MBL fold metallo-hydrolase [Nonomuraea pusilla]SEM58697.1 Glyoxylase, beta-lactamase superfamily II [Nonomuraea pusilla]